MTFPSDPAAMKQTLSIVTTRANLPFERIHNTRKRMPVMLRQEDEARWLEDHLDTSSSEAMNPYLPEFKVLHDLAETCLMAVSVN
jgi:putative SOS response-associated peptidase YedK